MAAPAHGVSDVLDPTVLEQLEQLRAPGAPSLVEELVGLWLEDTPRQLEAARSGADRGDWKAFADAVHRLVSSSAHLGAHRLADLCREAEAKAVGAQRVPDDTISPIEHEYARVRSALKRVARRTG